MKLNFPHQDDSTWLMIEVGGTQHPQYPSPLEMKMLIEEDRQHTKEVLMGRVEKAKKECRHEKHEDHWTHCGYCGERKGLNQALQIIEEAFKSE